jgi:hypothetical protein
MAVGLPLQLLTLRYFLKDIIMRECLVVRDVIRRLIGIASRALAFLFDPRDCGLSVGKRQDLPVLWVADGPPKGGAISVIVTKWACALIAGRTLSNPAAIVS